jgi:hypothetical protein
MSTSTTTPERTAPVLSKRAEFLLKVIMVIGGPLLLIALLEGMAYLWERRQANGVYAWEMVASRRIDLIEHEGPGAGYTQMEPGSRYEWQGIPVVINDKGLRSPETTYEKPTGTFRILNLGDSIAMGWGVREEETYGRLLEQRLNEGASGALKFEVINAGTPGWNLENELAYLQAEGLKYDPDLILLDLTLVNDIYGKNALLAHPRTSLIEWLRTHTHIWPFLSIQMRTMQARADGRNRIDVIDPPTEAASYFPVDPLDDHWDKFWAQIESIHRVAEENGIQVALALFPLEFQVLDEKYSTTPQELLTARAAEAGIPTLDLLSVFSRACREKPDGPCQLEDRYLFADVWMHPSAFGHELTAAELESFLEPVLR